jgi:hypothetical protein
LNAPSEDIKDMLQAEPSLGLTFATDLFIGQEPADPDNCVTIFDTPGAPPQLTYNKAEKYQYPSIQIRVRNRAYMTGWTLANNIKDALHGRAHETWNATRYEVIISTNEPALLDWDENGRARLFINFDIQRR